MAKTVRQNCQKCIFPPAEQNEGNIVLKKCINFWQFSDFRVDRPGRSMAIFKSFVKFEFFVSKEIFWIKLCLSNKKFFVSFIDFEQNLFAFLTRRFWARFSELHLRVHSNVFKKNIFFEKRVLFSQSYSVFKRSFSRFSRKNLQQTWQKCILNVKRNNWWKTNFLKKTKELTK